MSRFVPDDFAVPRKMTASGFRLEPLGPGHNDGDYAAWTSSMDHIRNTPGFANWRWPVEMTLEENHGDLVKHAEDFANRTGFTYSVLQDDAVIGCVYIYPAEDAAGVAHVRSWVAASHRDLDVVLWRAVARWLAERWPFENVRYAARG